MRRELLEFEDLLACHQHDVGLVEEFPFDPKVHPDCRVYHRATPFPPDRRQWVRKECADLVASVVLERADDC